MATGQNSYICSEDSCINPVADSLINIENIYNLCSEEAVNMPFQKGKPSVFKGHKHTKESLLKMSESHKGQIAWNKGKTDIYSEITLEKIRIAAHGRVPWNKGKKCPQLEGENNGMFGRHPTSPNKGVPKPETIKIKISTSLKGHISINKGKPGLRMENHPQWRGGISFEPYCPKFNKQLKKKIRERDNRTCQLCGVKENGRKLDVHHVHYDKPNCNPDLIALCQKCNKKANFDRDYWEGVFMEKLKVRGLIT